MIKPKAAANILLVLFAALALFHLLILLNVIPSDMVWGGRNASQGESIVLLESIGLIVTILFALIVSAKVEYIRASRLTKIVKAAMWFVFGFFMINIATNLLSESSLERLIFTPVSVVITLLAFRLAVEK